MSAELELMRSRPPVWVTCSGVWYLSETETPQLSVFMSDCRVNHCKRLPGGRTFKTQQIWFPTVSHSCNLLCVGLNIWIKTIIILSKSHFNLQRWKRKKISIYSLFFFVKRYTQIEIWNSRRIISSMLVSGLSRRRHTNAELKLSGVRFTATHWCSRWL